MHSFDVAKKNYVNLILANQGRHQDEGDSREMIESRKRFLSSGAYDCLRSSLVSLIKSFSLPKGAKFLDIACGEGYYTNKIHEACGFSSVGLDISKSAINAASSSRNQLGLHDIEYVIGNLDYLPILDDSLDVMLNCFAPINEAEFRRVSKVGGYYVRVLPDVYHLLQMKEVLYDDVRLNEPKEPVIEGFELINEIHVDDEMELDKQQVADCLTMTPYYYKSSKESKDRLYSLNRLKTRISFLIRVYRKIS